MDQETIQKGFYMTLCSKDEIDRIFNVKNTFDYLLKQRADATLDSTRIHRVFQKRCLEAGDNWNFSESFDETPFIDYKCDLEEPDMDVADEITAGFVFCDDPNGRIRKTEFGNVIMISESLRYFLYFMNLSYLHAENFDIPNDVRNAAMKIAIRTMLQSETLDFDMDPRGEIPNRLHAELQIHTNRQLEFVIGHEYSHAFLGHLDTSNVIEVPMLSNISNSPSNLARIYSPSQKNEFEADIDAIERPMVTSDERANHVSRALYFFTYLDVFESVKEQIFPHNGSIKTHPDPIERFWNIYNRFEDIVTIDKEDIKNLLKCSSAHKDALKEDVSINIDSYEFYGSIYLGSWRGKVLVDRVDF